MQHVSCALPASTLRLMAIKEKRIVFRAVPARTHPRRGRQRQPRASRVRQARIQLRCQRLQYLLAPRAGLDRTLAPLAIPSALNVALENTRLRLGRLQRPRARAVRPARHHPQAAMMKQTVWTFAHQATQVSPQHALPANRAPTSLTPGAVRVHLAQLTSEVPRDSRGAIARLVSHE